MLLLALVGRKFEKLQKHMDTSFEKLKNNLEELKEIKNNLEELSIEELKEIKTKYRETYQIQKK